MVQVRGECLFQYRCHTTDFLNFLLFKYERNRLLFYCMILLLYRYACMHMVHKREKYTALRLYISRSVNIGVELNVYGNMSL